MHLKQDYYVFPKIYDQKPDQHLFDMDSAFACILYSRYKLDTLVRR